MKVNILIILFLMLLTRTAYAIAFATLEPFELLNFMLCFTAYLSVTFIVSLLIYYLEGELK
jgi:ABC-type amino acid transport system permease subunit